MTTQLSQIPITSNTVNCKIDVQSDDVNRHVQRVTDPDHSSQVHLRTPVPWGTSTRSTVGTGTSHVPPVIGIKRPNLTIYGVSYSILLIYDRNDDPGSKC